MDEQAIEQNIKSRLLSWKFDCFYALQDGVDWRARLDAGQQDNLVQEVKGVILQSYGVTGINSVTAVFDAGTRKITVTYDIQTFFSTSFRRTLEDAIGG